MFKRTFHCRFATTVAYNLIGQAIRHSIFSLNFLACALQSSEQTMRSLLCSRHRNFYGCHYSCTYCSPEIPFELYRIHIKFYVNITSLLFIILFDDFLYVVCCFSVQYSALFFITCFTKCFQRIVTKLKLCVLVYYANIHFYTMVVVRAHVFVKCYFDRKQVTVFFFFFIAWHSQLRTSLSRGIFIYTYLHVIFNTLTQYSLYGTRYAWMTACISN